MTISFSSIISDAFSYSNRRRKRRSHHGSHYYKRSSFSISASSIVSAIFSEMSSMSWS